MTRTCPKCEGGGVVPAISTSVSPFSGVSVADPQEQRRDDPARRVGGAEMRDAGVRWVADILGIEPMNVALLATQRGMPHDRDDEGRLRFDLGEVDEWVGSLDEAGLREVFQRA